MKKFMALAIAMMFGLTVFGFTNLAAKANPKPKKKVEKKVEKKKVEKKKTVKKGAKK
jgi:hypothetical protein